MKLIDLRSITRDSDKIQTSISVYMGAKWEGISALSEWMLLGACDIRTANDSCWLSAYLSGGVTDFEHDSAYALRLGLIGLKFTTMYNGSVHLQAYIDPNDSSEFRVPEEGYNPMKLSDAYKCSDCKSKHIIIPEGHYSPPFNKELYEKMRGRELRILISPVRE